MKHKKEPDYSGSFLVQVIAKLEAVIQQLDRGNDHVAINQMQAFIHHVEAMINTVNNVTQILIVAATATDGIRAGASLDESIKQLPARHRIGVLAYSAYSRAADLGNGILW